MRDALYEITEEVLDAVIAVARAAPPKQHASVFAALVPWSKITTLRAELDSAGVEWR